VKTCEVCGSEIVEVGKGRPKQYCSPDCRDFSKYMTQVSGLVHKIRFGTKKASTIRGDFFRLANAVRGDL